MSATTTQSAESTASGNGAGETQMISGGHLVAKALKAEGIDVIYTLCGGHIIDIYDGCVDEGIKVIDVRHEQVAAHAADAYARVTGKPGCAVVTAGPGTTDAITGVANAFRAESPFLLIGGQGALNQHKMGSLQDLPHVDIMKPITKFASNVVTTERVADMCSMAFREAFAGAPGPVVPRDRSRHPRQQGAARVRGHPRRAEQLPRVDQEHRRSQRRRQAHRDPHQRRAPVRAPRQPGVDLARSRAGDRVRPRAQHPGVHERRRPRHAAAGRPAPFSPDSPLRVQQRGRDPDRRHPVRLQDGLRQAPLARGQGHPDRHGLPDGRQEPRHQPRPRRRSRRDPRRSRQGRPGPQPRGDARGLARPHCATRRSGSRKNGCRAS